MTDDEEVEIQVWVKEGSMLVNCYALEISNPMHPYNQILAQGKRPENYGIKHPYAERFENHSREQLIEMIVELENNLEGWARADAMGVLNSKNFEKRY